MDKTLGAGTGRAPSKESLADDLNESVASTWMEQLDIDMNNTYESLDFSDRSTSVTSSSSDSSQSPSQSNDPSIKRKRDTVNESSLSNTSVKHPVKRRKVDDETTETEAIPLPTARKWRFRDSFRFAIFGKRRGKKLM